MLSSRLNRLLCSGQAKFNGILWTRPISSHIHYNKNFCSPIVTATFPAFYRENSFYPFFPVHKEKNYVLNEIKIGLYNKPLYLCSKILYSFPKATLVFISYSLPVSSMAGLQNNLLLYLLLMMAYLHAIRMVAIAMALTFDRRSIAAIVFGLIFSLNAIASGTTIHFRNLSVVTRWLYSLSPMKYIHDVLIGWEFSTNVSSGMQANRLIKFCKANPALRAAVIGWLVEAIWRHFRA